MPDDERKPHWTAGMNPAIPALLFGCAMAVLAAIGSIGAVWLPLYLAENEVIPNALTGPFAGLVIILVMIGVVGIMKLFRFGE